MAALTEEVNNWTIGYHRYGDGPHPMLLLPGALGKWTTSADSIPTVLLMSGTSLSDFWEQLEGPNAFDKSQFTMIAADAPGWGRSSSKPRPYGPDVYENDVECLYQLMKVKLL